MIPFKFVHFCLKKFRLQNNSFFKYLLMSAHCATKSEANCMGVYQAV